ncbi:hypothetical protein PoB_005045500 [Plakobranchus ocellatus]|uniref:Uncharacterized protein n=1 Tax=Plakobranchus ocellatus TaxID=259542 RepID=A0AAV4BU23_9GAST|nr:hypothetical protein PoB_005045500 [Plakobranchus ocellatus]
MYDHQHAQNATERDRARKKTIKRALLTDLFTQERTILAKRPAYDWEDQIDVCQALGFLARHAQSILGQRIVHQGLMHSAYTFASQTRLNPTFRNLASRINAKTGLLCIASPHQSDLGFSGQPSSQGADGGARTRDRRVTADLKADSLPTVLPRPLCSSYILYSD